MNFRKTLSMAILSALTYQLSFAQINTNLAQSGGQITKSQALLDLEADEQNYNAWALVNTANIQGKAMVGKKSIALKGRSSFSLKTSADSLSKGLIKVENLNLAFLQVDQQTLSNIKPLGKATGVMSIQILDKNAENTLQYNAQTKTAVGEIKVNINFPQVEQLQPTQIIDGDHYESATIQATLKVQLAFGQQISSVLKSDVTKLVSNAKLSLNFQGMTLGSAKLNPMNIDLSIPSMPFSVASLAKFEVAKKLCVQPVRIKSSNSDSRPTGAGLAFGLPGMQTQWNKADIVFDVRSWKTITSSTLKIADNGTEEGQIRRAVQDDDCIEVFFVENFNPADSHGGGATWGSGTASAQVISSDGNAAGGIDLTHLAHEFGHVLALGHPNESSSLTRGNTGTLLCPSGWRRDNPAFNSIGNKNNANNPLLTFSIKPRTAVPDCNDNSDCGNCP